jgi:3-oxoadipate enol-lactonase
MTELIEVRGGPLAVDDSGGDGPALLWGHGLTSCRAHDAAAGMLPFPALAAAGWRVVRWDARGHGESPGPDDPAAYIWDELGRDALALADALGIATFVVGGASMGAATALHVARQAAERVRALVLACPPTAWAGRAAQAAIYKAGAVLVVAQGLDAYMERAAKQPVPPIFAPIGELFRPVPAVDVAVLPSVLRGAAASDLPAEDEVAKVVAPTLVLAWDTDPGHPLATATRVTELISGAELHVAAALADIGTWPPIGERFLQALPPNPN